MKRLVLLLLVAGALMLSLASNAFGQAPGCAVASAETQRGAPNSAQGTAAVASNCPA
jgi:hypothetical protein